MSDTPRTDAETPQDPRVDTSYTGQIATLRRQLAEKQAELEASKRLCEIYFNLARESYSREEIGRRASLCIDAAMKEKP